MDKSYNIHKYIFNIKKIRLEAQTNLLRLAFVDIMFHPNAKTIIEQWEWEWVVFQYESEFEDENFHISIFN